ncbi:MAG: hypothetical protein A3H27_07585 [Acidobacteria bacterium RIFCSPLOWO2_02_FULL_59_13]|nr:MAG: hypothetical protein A3H27_07585 [Acidobacteria bacterium RIFCSPLOWO2_02_FULL_59_13]
MDSNKNRGTRLGIVAGLMILLLVAGQAMAQTCVVPPSGMVGWWPGDGNANDIVGSNHGTGTGVAYTTGKVGQAFSLAASLPYVTIADNSALHVQELTIDAWVYFTGTVTAPKNQYFLRKWISSDGGYGSYAGFRTSGNAIGFTVQSQTPSQYPGWRSSASLSTDTWHHVAFTWKRLSSATADAADGKLYVDGTAVSTTFTPNGYNETFSIQYTNQPLFLGKTTIPSWAEPYNGLIDEVEIFNRALIADEIQAINDAGSAGKCREVDIDIKPGSDPNCFNINGSGVIPVAILGSEDFDVSDIDKYTLTFGDLKVRVRGKKGPLCSIEDVNEDYYPDMVCHFEDDGTSQWTAGNGTATLTGRLLEDGPGFMGTDTICVVP